MIKIKTLTLEIKENTVKMLVIEKYFGYVKFINMKTFEFNQIDQNGLILDINKLSKIIKNELNNFKIPCRRISFAVQNESIINRNVKVINTGYKGDIKGLIAYELSEYLPINIKDYILKYNILKKEEDYLDVQAILMPISLMKNYRELAKLLKFKPISLSVNFDILNKLIYNEDIEIEGENNLILDIGRQYTNVNLIKNKLIINSYTLNNMNVYEFLNNEIENNYGKIYYYGFQNCELIKNLNTKFKLNKLFLKDAKQDELNNFINNIGLI